VNRSLNPSVPETKPRLIYSWNYLSWGGSQIYILSLIKAALKEFNVYLVVPHGTDEHLLSLFKPYDVDFVFFSPPVETKLPRSIRDRVHRRLNKIRSENAMFMAIRSIADSRSVVHVDLAPQQSMRTLFRLCLKYNVFSTAHNSASRHSLLRELWWKMNLRLLTRFRRFRLFCANVETKSYLCTYLPEAYADFVTLTRAAINPDEINSVLGYSQTRSDLLARFELPNDKTIVLTVGQFVDRKGRWILLDAARQVCRTSSNFQFVWVMPKLPSTEDLNRIEEFGLGKGFRPILSSAIGADRESILRFFSCADLFVLPSLHEGLPIAILEAMALGIPTISTNINAIPEAVIHDKTGVLVEEGNAVELAQEILKLKDDSSRRERFSTEGRRHILDNFDERTTGEIALKHYKAAIAFDEAV
jgi:glycosyltransferase involved in cell wall biosynthesis